MSSALSPDPADLAKEMGLLSEPIDDDFNRTGPSIVILVFSKSGPLPERDTVWADVQRNLIQILQSHFQLHWLKDASVRKRFRDSDENKRARVCEFQLPAYRTTPDGQTTTDDITMDELRVVTHVPAMQELQQKYNIELVLQPRSLYWLHSQAGLAVFDMDSTLIQQEVIDELARAVGLYDQVSAITEAAMRGEAPYTDFSASLRARVGCLKGVPTTIWEQLKAGTITFTPGAAELVRVLKRLGWKTAVLSGGFTPLALWVKETLGLDYAYANHLVVDEKAGCLTGELVAHMPIIHAEKKRELLLQLASDNGIPAERCIAVGDGSNDLLMMGAAGLGVAFNAKPKVQLAAPARFNSQGLLDVLFLLGYESKDITAILSEEMVIENGRYVLRRPKTMLP